MAREPHRRGPRRGRRRGGRETFRDTRSTSSRATGRPAAAAPARLPLELLRLARAARARARAAVLAFDFLGFGLSDKPRDHVYCLGWQADLVEQLVPPPRRRAAGVRRRPRHGHVGRHRAAGARHRGPAGFELAGALLFNGSMILERATPTPAQRLLRSRARPARCAAHQRGVFRRSSARSSPTRIRSATRRPTTSGRSSATTAAAPSATSSSPTWTSATSCRPLARRDPRLGRAAEPRLGSARPGGDDRVLDAAARAPPRRPGRPSSPSSATTRRSRTRRGSPRRCATRSSPPSAPERAGRLAILPRSVPGGVGREIPAQGALFVGSGPIS